MPEPASPATPARSASPVTPRDEPGRLLRIQEVAAEVGLTTRSIRYYEEVGLLEPAARSDGDYRLFDPSDLERLRFIKRLRDDAGFSLTQIGQLLEDEAARERNRERLRHTTDPDERRAILTDALGRVERQLETLDAKAEALSAMLEDIRARRGRLRILLDEVDRVPAAAEASTEPTTR
jgi:MerR family transcriptional regulator, repressor of the yfmOP operon